MKTILVILCVCFYHISGCQNSRLGMHFLPGISDIRTELEGPDNDITPRFSFNAGFIYMLNLKVDFLHLETGVYFRDRGAKQRDFITVYNNQPNKISDLRTHAYFISIPLKLRFEKSIFYSSIGASLEYYLTTKYKYTPEEDKTVFIDWSGGFWNDIFVGIDFNLGVHFPLNSNFSFFTEYSFHPSAFSRITKNSPWNFNNSHELGLGIYYSFKK